MYITNFSDNHRVHRNQETIPNDTLNKIISEVKDLIPDDSLSKIISEGKNLKDSHQEAPIESRNEECGRFITLSQLGLALVF